MARVATIEAALLLDAKQWDRGFNDATRRLRTFEKATGSLSSGIAVAMASSALSVATLGTAFAGAIGVASSFEAGLRRLNTITELSDDALASYGDRLTSLSLELGTTTGAAENAAVAYEIASAGFLDTADNTEVLTATLKALTAGGGDADKAAKLIAGSLRAYGAEASEAGRFSDIFFATVKKGITTFPELSATLGSVTGVAAKAGVSLEELGAAIAVATSQGQQTSSVVSGLRATIVALQAPSKEASDEMARLGITVNESTLKSKGLAQTIEEISRANGGSAESFKRLLGSVEAVTVAQALAANGGRDYSSAAEDMQNVLGSTDAAVAEISKSFETSLGQFKVALEAAGIAIGEVFLPPLKLMVDVATAGLKAFVELPDPIRDLGVVAVAAGGGLLAATQALAGLTLLFPQLAGTLSVTNIALGLNTQLLNANVVTLGRNAIARVAASAESAVFTLATGTTTAAITAETGALVANEAALIGSAGASTAAAGATTTLAAAMGTLVLAVGAVVAILGSMYVIVQELKELEESYKAEGKYIKESTKSLASLDDAFKSTKKSAEELFESGKTSADLEKEMLALREASEGIRKAFDEGKISASAQERQLRQLADAHVKLRQKKLDLVEIEDERRATPLPDNSVDEIRGVEQTEEQKDAIRKEALEQALSDIRQLAAAREIEKEEEILRLQEVLAAHKTTAAERRRIEEQIAGLRGQLVGEKQKDEETKDRELEKKKEAARKGALDQDLSEIKQLASAREIEKDEQIRRLQEVLDKHKTTADERRGIEEQIAGLRGQLLDDAESTAEQKAKARREGALADELARIDELKIAKKISADEEIRQLENVLNTFDLTEQEKRRIHAETLQIRAKADQEAQAEKDKRDEEAKRKKEQEAEKLTTARDQGVDLKQQENTRVVERLQVETETKGVDNREKIKEALEANLALEIAQIEAAAERDKAEVDSAELKAQIQANAEAEVRAEIARTAEAQKSAIDEQIAALEKLKEAKREEQDEQFKGVFGIEELSDRLALERETTSRFRATPFGEAEEEKATTDTVEEIEKRLAIRVEEVTVKAPGLETTLNTLSSRLSDVKLSNLQPSSATISDPVLREIRFQGTLDVTVRATGGAELDQVAASTLDGRWSEVAREAGSVSGRMSFGG